MEYCPKCNTPSFDNKCHNCQTTIPSKPIIQTKKDINMQQSTNSSNYKLLPKEIFIKNRKKQITIAIIVTITIFVFLFLIDNAK